MKLCDVRIGPCDFFTHSQGYVDIERSFSGGASVPFGSLSADRPGRTKEIAAGVM